MANTKATRKAAKAAVSAVKRAAIYVRVSSEPQAKTKGGDGKESEEKESPRAQERDCRALADKQGYQVVAVYRDVEKYRVGKRLVEPSGTRADRPQLRKMLADARAGLFDVILAWREDRLYRSYRPMLDVLDCLEETGLDIELAKETFDKNLAPVKAWAARMELQAKHDRQMMGMAGRLAQGKAWKPITPYGYAVQNERYVIIESEAQWVRLIWQWFGDKVSLPEIRQRLIVGGAKQREHGYTFKWQWAVSYIRAIVKHGYYNTGALEVAWDGETYTLPLPKIIDNRTAEKVKARFAHYKAYPAGNMKAQVLAAGLAYCKTCGARMVLHMNHMGKYAYIKYECANRLARHNHIDGCAKSVMAHKIDAEVWRKAWGVITDPVEWERRVRAALAEKQKQEVDAAAACQELESKLDTLDFERQKVVTAYRKSLISESDLGTQMAALTFEEAGLRRELAENRLFVGDRAERFIAFAMAYRERLVAGAKVNFDPKTAEEKQALFEYKRWVVQGIVKRVDVLADKTPEVKIEFDDKMIDGEPLPADLAISDTQSQWSITDSKSLYDSQVGLYRITLTL